MFLLIIVVDQLLEMRKFLLFYFLLSSLLSLATYQDDFNRVRGLIPTDISKAKELALSLRERTINDSDEDALFRINYLLGYIYKEEGDFGKSIIYYLEAIRYAENSGRKEFHSDLASLYNRCGIIFRQFKSFELSEEYYQKSTEYSLRTADTASYIRTQYNVSSLLRDQGKHSLAIKTLEEILSLTTVENKKYFEILNRLSMTYYDLGNFELSSHYSKKLLNECLNNLKLIGYSNHILAKIEIEKGNYQYAQEYLDRALTVLRGSEETKTEKKSIFEVLVDLGTTSHKSGDLFTAISYYNKAEKLIPEVTQQVDFFHVYKNIANVHFEQSDYLEAKKYEDLYSMSLNNYLSMQEEIRNSDKRYNMDLITKRYFDEVAKQERIASILFYSKLISGSLLALLLMTIGYNWYQKVRLRKSIIQELVDLKVIS